MAFPKGISIENQFKPGVCPNPKGRPKTKAFREAAKRFLLRTTQDGQARIDQAVEEMFDMAMARLPRESIEWMRLLVETTDGKSTDKDEPDDDPTGSHPIAEPLNAWLKRATPEHDWDAPHLLLLQQKLEAIDRGELKRLIVSMPPRHGKSELLSVHAPVWFLERNPKREIITAGYAINLARKFSRKARKLAEKVGLPLNPKVAQAAEWETAEGGRVFAVGVGGGIAGHGADVFIGDDLVKNIQEAMSPLKRETTWDWLISEALTRLSPTGAAIVIMTRRHEADIIGSLVEGRDAETGEADHDEEESGEVKIQDETWEYIRLPAISEGDGDLLGRPEGEALWPKRWPIEALHRIRKRGEWLFAALYQQRPTPRSGGLFQREWFSKYVDKMPAGDGIQYVRYWDKASSLANDADYTAGVLMALRDGVLYVCDVQEKRLSPKGRRDLQLTCAENDPKLTITWIEHEGGSAGADAAEEEAKALAGHPVHWEHPTGPKWLRAESFASQCEAGNVVLVKGSWNRKFIEQLCSFPNGKHDDMVDAASGACRKLTAKRRVRVL